MDGSEVLLLEYTLPVSPTNLLIGAGGDIWFTSFWSEPGDVENSGIGRLDRSTGTVILYPLEGRGNVWDLAQDPSGNVWYTTANGGHVGRLDPSRGEFTDWAFAEHHYGLELEPSTGDVWVVTAGEGAGIYRLTPATNRVEGWLSLPYTATYDLAIDSLGHLWFTVQPNALQGVGRLVPERKLYTIWTMPTPRARPMRLHVASTDEIWLTQFAATSNSLARLQPSRSRLYEYRVPTSNAGPLSLVEAQDRIWFTQWRVGGVGRLNPRQATPVTTVLQPTRIRASRVLSTVVPTTFAVVPEERVAQVGEREAVRTVTGGFVEFSLPAAGSEPFGIVFESDRGDVWFAEYATARIGRILDGDADIYAFFLPVLLKGHAGSSSPVR
jgi:streptogramin lyase